MEADKSGEFPMASVTTKGGKFPMASVTAQSREFSLAPFTAQTTISNKAFADEQKSKAFPEKVT